jgi:hypothetical protein
LGSGVPLLKEQLDGGATLSGVRFDTIGDIPPIRDADAEVRFDGETVDVKVTKGVAYLPSDRSVTINSATMTVADLRKRPVMARLELDLSGEASAVAELASTRPVNALDGLDVTAGDFSGQAKAQGVVTFPLGATARAGSTKPVPVPAVDYDIGVELDGLSIAKPVSGQTLASVDGTLRATPGTLTGDLKGEFSGLPARVRFTEDRATGKRDQTLTATLDAEQRDSLLPGLADTLSGPTPITIKSGGDGLAADVDLTAARIRLAAIGWEKGRDVPAQARMRIERNGDTVRIRDFELTGEAIRARGALRIEKGRLVAADLDALRLSSGDNFAAALRTEGGRTTLTLDGERLDARAFLRHAMPGARAAPPAGEGPSILVTGKVRRLAGFNDEVLTDAALRLDKGSIALSGSFDRGGTLQFSRTASGLAISTNNAGAALRFADLYRRMGGGTLEGELKETAAGTFSGNVAIRAFTVSGEPRLAALVNERAEGSASLNEVTQAGLDASRAAFEFVQGRLTLRRGGIFIEEGVVRGETMGATVEGVVVDGEGRMDLSGTFMPARGLNRIAGSIPLLGALLGSGTRTGLIGITYRIAGEARNPAVYLNPLSLITPGVFRQIFE